MLRFFSSSRLALEQDPTSCKRFDNALFVRRASLGAVCRTVASLGAAPSALFGCTIASLGAVGNTVASLGAAPSALFGCTIALLGAVGNTVALLGAVGNTVASLGAVGYIVALLDAQDLFFLSFRKNSLRMAEHSSSRTGAVTSTR